MSDLALNRPRNTVRLYACGGGGTNIAFNLERHRGKPDVGFADLDICYLDTSTSNLASRRELVPANAVYLVDGLDGSGGFRAENSEEISQRVRDMLQRFKPADLNIILSTGGGGSGSVIAPSLVSEMTARGAPVIVIAIGDDATRVDAENTLKTLKSYEAISRKNNVPVVLAYFQNDYGRGLDKVDRDVEELISMLCYLYSNHNHGLDKKDLEHWLRFDKITSFQSGLVALGVVCKDEAFPNQGNIISVASLNTVPVRPIIGTRCESHCYGAVPENVHEAALAVLPVHFFTNDSLIQITVDSLDKLVKDIKETAAARLHRRDILSRDDKITDNGLVL